MLLNYLPVTSNHAHFVEKKINSDFPADDEISTFYSNLLSSKNHDYIFDWLISGAINLIDKKILGCREVIYCRILNSTLDELL